MNITTAVFVFLASTTLVFGCASSGTTTQTPTDTPSPTVASATFDTTGAKKVYDDKCSGCHSLETVDEAGGKDRAGWTTIVRRMVDDNGAQLSQQEVSTVIEYLARTKGQ